MTWHRSGLQALRPGALRLQSQPTQTLRWFSSQSDSEHWLERFPGLRDWLADTNRRWWIAGLVAARCKQHHQLRGRETQLRAAVEKEYSLLSERLAPLAVDSRSRTHLQMACLLMATHKSLLPWLRDEREVLDIVHEHMGARATPLLKLLMRVAGWMQRDPYSTLVDRLRGLQLDYGPAFQTHLEQGISAATLTVASCFYNRVLEEEGVPQLLRCCCCSQDRVWLEGVPRQGVAAALVSSVPEGDSVCSFSVFKVPLG